MNTEFISKPTMSLARRLTQNKHTSSMAVVVGTGELAGALAKIWCPHYQPQIEETIRHITHFAIIYGFVMAGDSKPETPKQTNPHQNNP